jgi:starch synthase
MKKLKIVHIASEVAPFSKTGGLGDVTRSLPKALKRLGHDVMIITPLYGQITDKSEYNLKPIFENVRIYLNSVDKVDVNFWKGYAMDDLPVYFIENNKYFSRHKKIYGSSHENVRFLIFAVASLKLLSMLKYKANIIHCHDWQTGLIPYYLKKDFRYSKTLKKAKTVFTIHNLVFQLGHNWWEIPTEKRDFGLKRIPHITDPAIETINFAKRAIFSADIINTVSEQYRTEIMTPNFGQDLHRILRNREDRLFGIINGIDYNSYNPEKDEGLYKNYNSEKLKLKIDNKEWLQKKVGLPIEPHVPVLCATSRISWQKGYDLILKALEQLLRLDIQFIFMGNGSKEYVALLKKFAKKYPKKMALFSFNEKIETAIYAGSDFFILPSHYEPCGINQLIAMRYGCIPIVHEVGGLYDTVNNYNPTTHQGTGFTYKQQDEIAFYTAVVRAVENYRHRDDWHRLLVKAMEVSSSWEIPAKKYVKLYHKALNL